jgi:hypothetical protein
MKKVIQTSLLLWLVSSAAAQEKLADYDWNDLAQRHELLGGQVVSMDGVSVLKIENTNDTALQLSLFKISNPPVSKMVYAITGEVRHEDVRGDGYLEMWNCFPPLKSGLPEGKYFSRTLDGSGEMGRITGTSGWRNFSLLFNRAGSSSPPTQLEINIFLPGRGTVYLRPAKLIEYKGNNFLSGGGAPNTWWSSRQAGMIGGIGGSVIGCFGVLIGCLAGMGKARQFVLALTKIFIVLGILLTIAGLAAAALKQPYAVWYVLLLPGVILTSVFGANLRSIQRRYDDLEIRRMTSIDVMGS